MVPVSNKGWTFLGEVNKWVGVSATRFQSIRQQTSTAGDSAAGLLVSAVGVEGEALSVAFVSSEGEYVMVKCVVGASGKVLISSEGTCV